MKQSQPLIKVIIPALNEEASIGKVLQDIPMAIVAEVVVVDNGSRDRTAEVARAQGATVLQEPERGYGAACLKGMAYLQEAPPDILVFLDADYSDYPEQLPELLRPILEANMDMVIGSRALGQRAKGSMTAPQRFGNWLSAHLLRLLYGAHFTDLGPFRAIRWDKLMELNMQDRNYGWTVEMQVKAARKKMRFTEVPVNYRMRIGTSKVSGTLRGVIGAGYKILFTIFKYALK